MAKNDADAAPQPRGGMDLASHLPALEKWARTKGPAVIASLMKSACERGAEASGELFDKAMEEAKRIADECSLPHSLIMTVGGLETRYGHKANFSLDCATLASGSAQMLARCAQAGLDPWSRASSNSKKKVGGIWRNALALDRASAQDMAAFCAGESVSGLGGGYSGSEVKSKATRVALVHLAMDHAPAHGARLAIDFGRELAEQFKRVGASSLKGAAGVMGENDLRAKAVAEIYCSIADKVKLACLSDPAAAKAHESAHAEALAYLELKKAKADFDPSKYKKAMPPERKERLITLCALLERSRDDPGAALVLAQATGWIAEEPNALCLPIKSHPSVLSAAMRAGEIGILEIAEQAGANIWIAAAQDKESNACRWVLNSLWGQQPDGMLGVIARMLAWGAHLDGAADPVGYALGKMEEAKSHHAGSDDLRGAMRSKLESIVFESMLAARTDQEVAEAAPRRRSSL